MAEGYKIRSHSLLCGSQVLVLMPEDSRLDFLDEMGSAPKQRQRYRLIVRTIEKIGQLGVPKSIKVGFVRMLEPGIGLVEVRVAGKVIRVMAYTDGAEALVLLFDFDGHQGTDKLKGPTLAKGRRLAAAAKKCLEE